MPVPSHATLDGCDEVTPQAYWEYRLAAQFDLRGSGCRVLGKHYNAWLYRVRRHIFLRHVCPLGIAWSTARVADIGSGTGFYVNLWRRLGVRSLVGIDFSPTAVARVWSFRHSVGTAGDRRPDAGTARF